MKTILFLSTALSPAYWRDWRGNNPASEAIGINNYGLQDGLQFKCNDYNTSKYDIYVYGSTSTVAASQGSLTDPANNLFSNGGPILVSDLKNDGNFVTYYHANLQSNSRVKPLIYSTDKLSLIELQTPWNENSCPTFISGQRQASATFSCISNTNMEISGMNQQLQQLTDEGNTEGLSLEVETAIPQEAYQKYIELLQTSPYISEEVLKSLGQNENGFSANMVRDVMISNPHSAKSEEVMIQLENRVNQMPVGMMKQIKKGKERVSAYENLKAEIAAKTAGRNALLSDGILSVINKDSLDNINDVLGFYALMNKPEFKTNEAEIYFSRGEYNEALSVLQNAINLAGNKEKEYYVQLNGFYSHLIEIINNGEKLDSLPQTEIEWLTSFEPNHAAFAKAQNLMGLNNEPVNLEPLFLPEESSLKSGFIENKENDVTDVMNTLVEIYPNPAKDFVTILYELEGYENLELNVTDATGKVLLKKNLPLEISAIVLDLSKIKTGQYFLTFYNSTEKVIAKPLTIIR